MYSRVRSGLSKATAKRIHFLVVTDWPHLPYAEWVATRDTLHMWLQIVGKTRMAFSPPQNHWWHVSLYVTARGLTTSIIHSPAGPIDIEFDFIGHELVIRPAGGVIRSVSLHPRSVADFYAEYVARLKSMGIELKINRKPQEVEDTTPFDQDTHHASYDREYVERFHRILLRTDAILKQFRSAFIGKCSPVHFFWGSMDMAVTRFSGRRASTQMPDPIMQEAYSHEVSSCGFWPGDPRFPHPSFYAYMAPVPPGLDEAPMSVGGWNSKLGEHVLEYENVRQVEDPEGAVLKFFEEAYRAGSRLANWDTAQLVCA
jgi:hypothetical protein